MEALPLATDRAGAATGWPMHGWRHLKAAALLCVLMLSPSSFRRGLRGAVVLHVWQGVVRHSISFVLLSSLVSVVLIRIVLVTAQSYGLSEFALEAMVRVLVLELIPLFAALFVAIRLTLPAGADLRRMQARGDFAAARERGVDPLVRDVLPRAAAGLFAVPALAVLAAWVAMILCYLTLYGATPWAFGGYTRAIGRIFEPAVALIFCLKALAFSVAVSMIPMASAALPTLPTQTGTDLALQNLVRMSLLILLIEVLSLLGNYYG